MNILPILGWRGFFLTASTSSPPMLMEAIRLPVYLVLLLLLLAYPLYLLLMAAALAVCGASRNEIKKWALKQAGRQRLTDLIRAARGLPERNDEKDEATAPPGDSPTAA